MVIELRMARGWRIWIDGVQPVGEWELGENEKTHSGKRAYDLRQRGEALQAGDHWVDYVWFDVDEDNWGNTKPSQAVIAVDGRQRVAKVTKVEWGDVDTGPVTVELFNGEKLELDEITAYVRLEL